MELFDALQTLLDPNSRIHPGWKKATLSKLPRRFEDLCHRIGGSSEIWPVIPAILPKTPSSPTFDQIISSIQDRPLDPFQREILLGFVHCESIVSAVLDKGVHLKSALARAPRMKQEWLHFIGLYPYQADSPSVIAIQYLIDDPGGFRKTIVEILEIFWETSFQSTWSLLKSQLERSRSEKERLFQSCSFDEFAQQTLLRVEVDEKRGSIKALRGGYKLAFRDVKTCQFIPSAFNDRRYWSALPGEHKHEVFVYFPYFDPSITLDLQLHRPGTSPRDPELDPALIFKALGDTTRYAIVSMVAKGQMSSVELAGRLSVSKPTISHHVHHLREAGLIDEHYSGGSVQISLRRDVIERISELAVERLFNSDRKSILKTTRRKEANNK